MPKKTGSSLSKLPPSGETMLTSLPACKKTSVSQAARQGVAVLMVTVQVVLKGVYSTPCQTFSFDLNDFKFGVIDYVPGYPNPTKFGLDRSSGGAPTWW